MPTSGSPKRQTDRGRAFLADHPLEAITIDGAPGVLVSVRLTSYRSLPLSCLEKISLWINGDAINSAEIELILGGHAYALDELPAMSHLWWFILDVAHLRVRLSHPLSQGDAQLRGELVTVEPYVSNGRFHFVNTAERTLSVVAGREEGVLHV